MKIFSWCDLEKRSLRVFFCKRRAPFAKSSNVGCHFCATFHGFCPNFQGFCPNFQEFFPDFRQIKTRGGALAHPRYSRLLHSFFAHFPFGIAPLRIPVLAPLGGRVPIFKGFWRFCLQECAQSSHAFRAGPARERFVQRELRPGMRFSCLRCNKTERRTVLLLGLRTARSVLRLSRTEGTAQNQLCARTAWIRSALTVTGMQVPYSASHSWQTYKSTAAVTS